MSDAGVYLEAGGPGDAPALADLDARASTHPWSERAFLGALAAGAGERVGLLRDLQGRLVGFCVWQEVADEAHVHNVAIRTECRREGLGRRLLSACLGLSASRGARRAFLDVRRGNAPARALYRRLGFRETGVRTGYYTEPAEDALLLEADLPLASESLKTGLGAC
ncbi:MAG: ribosomal protein S18-alanine N-acetyltransferase [Vicinamibacteria bacterium]